jgi:hypothetical protein
MVDIEVIEGLLFLAGLLLWEFGVLALHFWKENKDGSV